MNQLKDNITFWRTFPMSMAGKINAIKMVTLPRFLYLFSSIPVLIPVKLFAKLESIIISFIWNYKNVRISKKHLFKPKAKGGFSLPHFRFYYWAANLQSLSWWRQTPENNGEIPEWVWLERTSCSKTSLEALLNSPIKIESRSYNENIIVNNSLKIGKRIKSFLDRPHIYLDSPICKNHAFTPGLHDKVFSQWKQKGLISIRDLYIDNKFGSFTQIKI